MLATFEFRRTALNQPK